MDCRVFHVAIGRIGGQILTGFAFLLHNRLDLFTAVLDIELVDDIQERSKVIVLLVGAVHTAVHGDETDIVFGEKHFRVETDLQIVSADTAHILGDDDTDLIVLDQLNHSFPIGSVEVGTRVTIVHERLDVAETLFLCVFFENRLLETDLSRGFYSENTRNYNTATRTTAICHILYRLVYTACINIHFFANYNYCKPYRMML